MAKDNKKKCFVISHTHWDREWYQTFQDYRFRLVRMFDDLLEILEANPDYKVFHTDGQTIVLEDYLEICPENRERIQKLIDAGKLIIGPWYVMPDEFLISGESLVRNLQ
ncbi:MAG TPA: alpha-mannosidase, partial [Clostridiales bacterium]|nr:alpha-mannosidase [Clostridiales bacterium]